VRSAFYVDRILRGEQPTGPPVQQPTKFQLVINLKSAPPSLADRTRRRADILSLMAKSAGWPFHPIGLVAPPEYIAMRYVSRRAMRE
jgi:hypothetical protein